MKIMVISVSHQPFLKMRKFLLDMRKDFLIMSNFYLVEILGEPNSLTIVTSKKILKMSNYVLILSIFFLIMRIRNFQWKRQFTWSTVSSKVTVYPPIKVRSTPFRAGPNLKYFFPAPLLDQSTPLFMAYFSCRIRPSPVPFQSS